MQKKKKYSCAAKNVCSGKKTHVGLFLVGNFSFCGIVACLIFFLHFGPYLQYMVLFHMYMICMCISDMQRMHYIRHAHMHIYMGLHLCKQALIICLLSDWVTSSSFTFAPLGTDRGKKEKRSSL